MGHKLNLSDSYDSYSSNGSCDTTAVATITMSPPSTPNGAKNRKEQYHHRNHSKQHQKNQKQQQQQQQLATATFEGRKLLIVNCATEPINNLLPASMVTARAVVIQESHPSHSSQQELQLLQSILRWTLDLLQGFFFVGDSLDEDDDADVSFCSSYEGNSQKRKMNNPKMWVVNHRFVRIAMLLLASIRMIAMNSDSFSGSGSNSNSNLNMNSGSFSYLYSNNRRYPGLYPNNAATINIDLENFELGKPREAYIVNTKGEKHQQQQQQPASPAAEAPQKESLTDKTVLMIAATSDQNAQLVVADNGVKIRFDLDEWAALAYLKIGNRAAASDTEMEVLAQSTHNFKFVIGLEGDDVDNTAEGHIRKFLLCFQPFGAEETSRKNKHTASGTPIFKEDRKLRNTIRGDRARRSKREADYQRARQEVLSSGFLSTNMGGGEGRCIAITLDEMREHDFHSEYGDALVYIRSTGSAYERELYVRPVV